MLYIQFSNLFFFIYNVLDVYIPYQVFLTTLLLVPVLFHSKNGPVYVTNSTRKHCQCQKCSISQHFKKMGHYGS